MFMRQKDRKSSYCVEWPDILIQLSTCDILGIYICNTLQEMSSGPFSCVLYLSTMIANVNIYHLFVTNILLVTLMLLW